MIGHIRERIFIFRKRQTLSDLHRVMWVYAVVFVVWGLYRLLLPTTVWLEETVLKFIVFGLPAFWVVLHKENGRLEDLGMTTKGLITSLYFGLIFGLWLAIFGNVVSFINNGSIGFNPQLTVTLFRDLMVLGLFTAFWEQLLFMGFMLPRVVNSLKQETWAILIVALLFALLHMPVQLAMGVDIGQILIRFALLFSLAYGNGILYLRFRNLSAPVFAHLAWGVVIFMFG